MFTKDKRLTEDQIAALEEKYGEIAIVSAPARKRAKMGDVPDGAVEYELAFRAPKRAEWKMLKAKASERGGSASANEVGALTLIVVVTGASPVEGDADAARAALNALLERFPGLPDGCAEALNNLATGGVETSGNA